MISCGGGGATGLVLREQATVGDMEGTAIHLAVMRGHFAVARVGGGRNTAHCPPIRTETLRIVPAFAQKHCALSPHSHLASPPTEGHLARFWCS